MINFKLFENLQQAEKFMSDKEDKTQYNKLKEYLKSKGKLGLLYLFTYILYYMKNNTGDYFKRANNYDDIMNVIDRLIESNIKFDVNEFMESDTFNHFKTNGSGLLHSIKRILDKSVVNKLPGTVAENLL